MNLWLTETVAAAHVDDLLRRAGQPVRPAPGGPSPLRAERLAVPAPLSPARPAPRLRPRVGDLLIRVGTRIGGAAPVGARVATGAGTGC